MHAKSKISGMISKGFNAAKCKTSLKLASSRIKLIKNKKQVLLKQMKHELAQLLATGQEQTALIRVEHVIREEKRISAYDLIEVYCELIAARLPIIESQKSCPIDLKEAISSVIFASPRCEDIPELMEIRKHLTTKYGKEFIIAALDVRPDCGVSHLIIEKLSSRTPDAETKIKALTEVAKEHFIRWEPKSFMDKRQISNLLEGSTSIAGAGDIRPESSNLMSSSDNYSSKLPEDNARAGTSTENVRGSTTPIPPKDSEKKHGDLAVRNEYPKEGYASLNSSNWTLEFEDAASAAQAAAESAERASMAAKAAAELARNVGGFRQPTIDSNETTVSACAVKKPLHAENDNRINKQVSRPEIQNLKRDKTIQSVADTRNVTSRRASSSGSFIVTDMPDMVQQKNDADSYDNSLKNSTASKFPAESFLSDANGKATGKYINPAHDKSAYLDSGSFSNYTDNEKRTIKLDFSGVILDEYDPDDDDHPIFEVNSKENEINYSLLRNEKSDSRGSDEHRSESLFGGSSSDLSITTEFNLPVVEDDHLRPTYDSEGYSSDGRDVTDILEHTEATLDKDNNSKEDESYISQGLNFGRLTGGLKNKGHTPLYVKNRTVSDTTKKEIVASAPKKVQDEDRSTLMDLLPAKASTFKAKDTYFEKTLVNTTDDESTSKSPPSRNFTVVSDVVADPEISQESNMDMRQPQRKQQKTTISRSSLTDLAAVGHEEENYDLGKISTNEDRDASPSVKKLNLPDQSKMMENEFGFEADNNLSSRMQRYSAVNDGNQKDTEPHTKGSGKGNRRASLSPKTKLVPSDATKDASSGNHGMPARGTYYQKENTFHREGSEAYPSKTGVESNDGSSTKPTLPYLTGEEPKMKHSGVESLTNKSSSQHERRNSSTDEGSLNAGAGQTLHDDSPQTAYHIHPKLPDYDKLAAHFELLKSRLRPS